MIKVLQWIGNVDRRIIFILVALAVIIPLLLGIGMTVDITDPVLSLYQAIDSLPSRSVILLSIDYDPGAQPELYPATLAVMRHAFSKDLRVIVMGMWAPGVPLGLRALDKAGREEHQKVYGIDYVDFGYKPGAGVMLMALGTNIRDVCVTDYQGVSIDSFPMMHEVKNAKDIDQVVSFSSGVPGANQWIFYYQARYHTKLGVASTSVGAPAFYPYVQSRQLTGLIGGMKGAAEYEQLVKKPELASAGMLAQSTVHAIIAIFIIIGNIIFFLLRFKT